MFCRFPVIACPLFWISFWGWGRDGGRLGLGLFLVLCLCFFCFSFIKELSGFNQALLGSLLSALFVVLFGRLSI
jgi:hypothetical protein